MPKSQPNLILVMTDDQGYGDLGCTGNPWIDTPNLDAFSRQCTRLNDFHVSPLCTPTRGALMSGHNPLRNGAWATTWGRSLLRRDEVTMADIFAENGYRTGMFGKWHLGDNFPYRPQDRGFQTVVAHRGGGVGQTPDFWGNTYFDDTYFHNGKPKPHEGYCTDIWFDEAMRFIENNQDAPFFCYLATNAPHAPYRVDDAYTRPYLDNENIPHPAFYGMITNIDENMGRLLSKLDELGLSKNTILIFMTDNGSSGGWDTDSRRGYNAGMRGRKGSYYDGGHRVPFFIRWPEGGIREDLELPHLTTHTDLLPTFTDLCNLGDPDHLAFDGISLAPLLRNEVQTLPERNIFVQYRQSMDPPQKWENAVLSGRWRLVRGEELYDIHSDPGQQNDIAEENAEIVQDLRRAHEEWWNEVAPGLEEVCPLVLGDDAENPTTLCAFDVLGDVAWDQSHIKQARACSGRWRVEVARPGRYAISLRRWPTELGLPIDAALADEQSVRLAPSQARLTIGNSEHLTDVRAGEKSADFPVALQRGVADLRATFLNGNGEKHGAYYVRVERQ